MTVAPLNIITYIISIVTPWLFFYSLSKGLIFSGRSSLLLFLRQLVFFWPFLVNTRPAMINVEEPFMIIDDDDDMLMPRVDIDLRFLSRPVHTAIASGFRGDCQRRFLECTAVSDTFADRTLVTLGERQLLTEPLIMYVCMRIEAAADVGR
jgi:hypothetical protein